MSGKKLRDLPRILQEAIAGHEVMRRFGFLPEQIHAVIGFEESSQKISLGIRVRVQDKEFSLGIGPIDFPEKEFGALWAEAAETWLSAPEVDARQLWEASKARRAFHEIAMSMLKKGLALPALDNLMQN